MDRNGKKPKAARADEAHAERSDTKGEARATLERMKADAILQRERGGRGGAPAPPQGKRGGRRA